jgi:putative hydrolase of the HAD superfamily
MGGSTIQAVLFDVGGVLTLPGHDRVREALGTLGLSLDGTTIDSAHYIAVAEVEGWNAPNQKHPAYEDYLAAYVRALEVPASDSEVALSRLLEHFGDGSAWTRVVPGARELLRALDERGLRFAIVSNTRSGGVEHRLRDAGICQVGEGEGVAISAIIDSHEVGVMKPHPSIFHVALSAMDVDPARAVFIGDSLLADIRGAHAVGMMAVHFDPLRLCPLDDHSHAASLSDIASLI